MNKKLINVTLAKIDYYLNEPYLYLIADCPQPYVFNSMTISACTLKGSDWADTNFDASGVIAGQTSIKLAIPVLAALSGVNGPAVYSIVIKAQSIQDSSDEIEDELFISDVYHVYKNILNSVLSYTSKEGCPVLPGDVLQQYLLVYTHQQALEDGDLLTAKNLFKLMHHEHPINNLNHTDLLNCKCHD